MKHYIKILFFTPPLITLYAGRNIHRYHRKDMPRITVWSSEDKTKFKLADYNLRPIPLLHVFDKKHFEENLIPKDDIVYRNSNKKISYQKMNALIKNLLDEIDKKNKEYTDFKILKGSGFVRHKKCGLLVLKFKDHPFILKLFIEPPYSFVNPYDKGFEVTNFFIAGGALRHSLGFTRIKTLNYVQQYIDQNPKWKDHIALPRKWFWLPEKPVWLYVKTHNLGQKKKNLITMPSTYGVLADELIKDSSKSTDYYELMGLSQDLEHRIDPHTKNFFIEKGTGKVALIDTELFPVIFGFNEKIKPHNSHVQWYTYLAGKYLKEKACTFHYERRERQYNIKHYYVD
ncbi:TPA: hypothetical protein DIC20_04225 [Candidatus Dependentiae bacterium]|nr:MAG: hypothetical protein US03_C0004G0057 [candidate division TM6 bacterium GW2011_GWF2_36_131]KKQ03235.1 MAG: hypothetical protein US13_C0004G0057 [candidate division TM6 bacterium GW2011_GWE2_36_25]KKQ19826.1 MAG: hypothetical protein US32_C0004G0010 [candidate division TM6 bacterium GW2011_GWA2_36_9]HBR70336.1 hypothetical protein [Candidatus Dependentiae bacterium]HCU00881.1 hypothetical protein [Candidatus Dependentiae bacterium]